MAADCVVLQEGRCYAEVGPHPLDLQKLVDLVADDGAGAVATFTGTTRNTFQGKRTERLEYEAYVPMAVKKLLVGDCLCARACIDAAWVVAGRLRIAGRVLRPHTAEQPLAGRPEPPPGRRLRDVTAAGSVSGR